ncbi:MAG: Ig-like domain-containing protein [Bacteroidales bacterium]|nr:Ig-like domain-containing protein [Bacteroidales bacterium]
MNRILLVFFISCLIFSCAKIVTPSGGAKDSTPPLMLKSKPEANSTNFSGKEIDIVFDEFIVLDNPTQKILISPQITPAPEIMADLKTIKIKGIDSLRENTTYIIDFADAIKDYNEGNRLNGFSFAFSTGENIDTMWYEGRVLEAFNLTPIANKFVLLYSNFDTSYMRTKTSDYLTRTDSNGVFRFRNLAEKDYKLLVLDDKNQNKIYDLPNEGIGFSTKVLKPYLADSTANDKLLKQIFYYSDFVEKVEETPISKPQKTVTDSLFAISKYEKDTVDYYNNAYQIVFKDTLTKENFSALLIENSDTLQVEFLKKNDTLYSLNADLKTATQYEIIIEKNTVFNTLKQSNREFKHKFYYSSEQDYGALTLNFKDSISFDACHIFYLYNLAGNLVREEYVEKEEEKISFKNLKEGAYKVKVAIDENCNKTWDKANFELQQENEKVLIYNKVTAVKRGWEIEEEWIISQ